jgi:Tol biopolymer transport system component
MTNAIRRGVAAAALMLATCAMAQTGHQGSGSPVVSPDGSRIAFESNRNGTSDLYVIDANGRNVVRLTNSAANETRPVWSRDSKTLTFGVTTDGVTQIFSIDRSGKSLRPIGSLQGRSPQVSPDGKRVVYATGGWTEMKLWSSALDGSDAKPLSDGAMAMWNAEWSPDGSHLAFTGSEATGLSVWVMRADGTERRKVTHLEASEGRAQVPAWSADGKKLAFQVNGSDREKHVAHIWTLDLASGDTAILAPHDAAYVDEVPSWFPDGKRIAFQSDRSGSMELWVMKVEGSGAKWVEKK